MTKEQGRQDQWRDILRRKIGSDSGIIVDSIGDRVETAIKRGSVWIAEQKETKPAVAGLCLEYVSKHIARQLILAMNRQESKTESLFTLELIKLADQLADQLEEHGIDVSKVSKEILEDIAGTMARPNRQARRWPKSKNKR